MPELNEHRHPGLDPGSKPDSALNAPPINLFNFTRQQLRDVCVQWGEKPFRATQLIKWIHQHGVIDIAAMTDLRQQFRSFLQDRALVTLPEVVTEKRSSDATVKWVLRLADGNCIETVFIPEKTRGTLCVSSQVGCALDCQFCSTGKQGFNRNLTTAEIITQLWLARHALKPVYPERKHIITNVVFMGMGEPLLNLDAVVNAMDLMLDDCAYGLSKYRVTLSTSGLVPLMRKLRQRSPVALAVSLHAPNDQLRNQLMPINRKYPLKDLMAVCRDYFKSEPKRKIVFEYVMLKDINDHKTQARELIKLLQGIPSKVNLIPFNPFPGAPYQRPTEEMMTQFGEQLLKAGIHTTIRRTRGDEVDAACGQLVGQVKDRTRRAQKWQAVLDLQCLDRKEG